MNFSLFLGLFNCQIYKKSNVMLLIAQIQYFNATNVYILHLQTFHWPEESVDIQKQSGNKGRLEKKMWAASAKIADEYVLENCHKQWHSVPFSIQFKAF